MFLLNLNGFNSSAHYRINGFLNGKVLPRCGRKKGFKWFCHFFSLFASCFCFCLFSFQFWFILFFHIKIKRKNWKKKILKQFVFVYIGTCVSWMAIETKFSKLCIAYSLDEHLYAQLSKWGLWFRFVMSKIKWSLVLNTRITLFDGND